MSYVSLQGGKAGSSSFKTKPDSLRSDDSFEMLLGLGSGRWKGLSKGLQSLYINNVPLENEDNTSNFKDFAVFFADGDPSQTQLVNFKLGGGGGTTTVGTTIGNVNASGPGPWVTAAVSTPGADFIDLRFVVNALYYQDKKGIRENTMNLQVEMRPSGTNEWINPLQSNTAPAYNQDGIAVDNANIRLFLARAAWNLAGNAWNDSTPGVLTISGKTTSPFVKELRIAVPNTGQYANKTWQIRVRLNDRELVQNDPIEERRGVQWESVAAVSKQSFGSDEAWRGLVWLQVVGKASDQLSGVPELMGIYKTKIVKTPPSSVYNPDTRQYSTNIWDGSYSLNYTDDPAWCLKDLIEDSISGIAALSPGATLDKWDALEVSKYSSTLVPDGRGGMHPRFGMNLKIDQAQNAEELVQYIAGAINSIAWDSGDGVWRMKQDKPESPVALYTRDNIIGEFQYQHTDVDTRYNDYTVTFLNKDNNYTEDRARVYDQANIDAYGRKPTTVVAVGANNRQEALRRAMFRLRVSLNENKIVNFVTNRQGLLLRPLDVILVADTDLGYVGTPTASDNRTTTRLESRSGTTLNLGSSVRLENGINYIVAFTYPNPTYNPDTEIQPNDPNWQKPTVTISRVVTNNSSQRGDVSVLYVDSALPASIAENAVVALSAANLPSLPRQYRVLDVTPQDDEFVSVSALIVDTGKYTASDNVNEDEILGQVSNQTVPAPEAPADGMFEVRNYEGELGPQRVLGVTWLRPGSLFLDGFKVEYNINDGPWIVFKEKINDTYVEIQNPTNGKYTFRITTLDRRGRSSVPLISSIVIDETTGSAPPHNFGPFALRPVTGVEGERYTTTDLVPNITYVWKNGVWMDEATIVKNADDIYYGGGPETVGDLKPAQPGATDGMNEAEKISFADVQAAVIYAQEQIDMIEGAIEGDFGPIMESIDQLNDELDIAQNSISGLQGSVGNLNDSITTINANVGSLQSQAAGIILDVQGLSDTIIAQGGDIDSVEYTLGVQGSTISDIQLVVNNTTGNVATLQTLINAGGGNLLVNTDLATDTSGWIFETGHSGIGDRAPSGDQWMVTGENGLRTRQENATTSSQSDWIQNIAIEGGKWYDVSVYVASHRARVQVYLVFLDFNGNAIYTPDTGPIDPVGGGNSLANFVRRYFKAQAPANAVSARLYLRKFGTLSGATPGNSYAWWVRPQVAETKATTASPLAYSVGSNRASILVQSTAISSMGTTVAGHTTLLSSHTGYIENIQLTVSGLTGTVSTVSETVASQGSSITTLQSTVNTQSGDLTTLKTQVVAGGGNLLTNTDLPVDTTGWDFSSQNGATLGRNLPGSAWFPPKENTFTVTQANNNSSGISDITQIVEVTAGLWYDASAYCASHRCNIEVIIQWIDSANNSNLGAPSSGAFGPAGGGNTLSSFVIRSVKAQAPAGAVRARFYLRKHGTLSGSDSYAWFLRPQVAETRERTNTPLAYSPGSARVVITTQSQAISTLDGKMTNVTTRLGTAEATISSTASTLVTAQGSISTLQETVSSQGGSITTLQNSYTTLNGTVSTLSQTVGSQGSSIINLQNAVSTTSDNLATLTTRVEAGTRPNLLTNGSAENGLADWSSGFGNWGYVPAPNSIWGSYFYVQNAGTSGEKFYHLLQFAAFSAGHYATASAEVDMYGTGGITAYLAVRFLDVNYNIISEYAGGSVSAPIAFSAENNRKSLTFTTPQVSPNGTTRVAFLCIFRSPNGASLTSGAFRRAKLEQGSTATPYTADASISQQWTAYTGLNTSLSNLTTTVGSQGGSITTVQNSFTSLNGTVVTLSNKVETQNSNIINLQSTTSTHTGQISTLETQVSAGGGNLLVNTDVAINTAGWTFESGHGGVPGRNTPSASWYPPTDNTLTTYQGNEATSSQSDWTQYVGIEGGKWYDVSVYVASHRANTQIYLVGFDASNNSVGTWTAGPFGPFGGGNTLASFALRSFKFQAPANMVSGLVYLRKFGTLSGSGSDSWAWWLRPQVIETREKTATPVSYSPGSSKAAIRVQAEAINTINTQYASLSITVGTQGSSITTQGSAITTLEGSQATLSEKVETQGSSITNLQIATNTLNGQTATLTTQVTAGNPNLLRNSSFELGNLNYWVASNGNFSANANFGTWGSYAASQANTADGSYTLLDSNPVQVERDWYTLTADVGYAISGGTGSAYLELIFRDASNNVIGQIGGQQRTAGFNFSSDGYTRRLMQVTTLAPLNVSTAQARIVWYKANGTVSSMHVRQVKLERGQFATSYSSEASITQSFQVLNTLGGQYSGLNTTVETLTSSVSTQQIAINNLQGKTAAYWQVEAVAGGRAQLRVFADANGGAGVDIVGDVKISGSVRIDGNTFIGGTVNPEALALDRFVKRVGGSGAGSPSPGQSLLIYSANLGTTTANGSYLLELSGSMTTTVGRQQSTYNGKPFYVNHNPDGGFLIRLQKNGSTIHETYIQASGLVSSNNIGDKIVSLAMNIVSDSPGGADTGTGNVVVSMYAIRGNQDTGIVNQGDYYDQNVSATYKNVAVALKAKWTFI